METNGRPAPAVLDRLWKTSRYLPRSVRLLGTRYRPFFLAHARLCEPVGELAPVADAISFIDFMLSQSRMALLGPERKALSSDARPLRRRYALRRQGQSISVRERWRILQWLSL